ncbi:competence protein CoiA family protein [uncultured Cellulomonas sp.]|uniref:competence protein CoiA family protein n=1 Tax=uncultured Cellulomonas sp. TaxID=189682 RepID=UPI0028E9B725|nr:competence protein CoiA family protein [uncultured Cellulomonas sp.]
MTDVLYPVARAGGELVWATDLARDQQRPAGMSCVGCAQAVSLRAGTKVRPHFGHRPGAVCTAPETVLHSTAIQVIATALSDAIMAGDPYPVQWWCGTCSIVNDGNLARGQGRTITVDTALPGVLFRPDIAVLAAGRPIAAVEVVVTHDVDDATAAYFDQAGMAVIRVWPTWETLAALRSGFLLEEGSPRFTTTGAVRCTSPAHIEPVVPCGTCAQPADAFRLETVRERLDCWQCHNDVPVLELSRVCDGEPFNASDPRVTGVSTIAAGAGVTLAETFSKTAGHSYLMHRCPTCNAKVGDFYAYGVGGLVLAGDQVRFASRCTDGHWTRVAAVPVEQTRSPFERGEMPMLWGEDGTSTEADDERVTSGSAQWVGAGGISVQQAVSRMFGGGLYR